MELTPEQKLILGMGGVSAIPTIIQGIQGIRQNAQANKMLRNIQFPEMGIPTAATEQLGVARNLASSFQMPGQAQAEQALNQQLAGGLNNVANTATSAPEALAAAVQLNANRMNAQNTLAGQAAQNYMQREQNLQNQLGQYADWQNAQWEWNKKQKYLYDSAAASAMKQAGQTNMFNAASNLTGIGLNVAKMIADQKKGETPDNPYKMGGGASGGWESTPNKGFSFSTDESNNYIDPILPTNSVSGGIAAKAYTPNYNSDGVKTSVNSMDDLSKQLSQFSSMKSLGFNGFKTPTPQLRSYNSTLPQLQPSVNDYFNSQFGSGSINNPFTGLYSPNLF